MLQNIESTLPASFPASAVAVWPTVAECFAPCLPHDQYVPEQLYRSLVGLAPAAGPPAFL